MEHYSPLFQIGLSLSFLPMQGAKIVKEAFNLTVLISMNGLIPECGWHHGHLRSKLSNLISDKVAKLLNLLNETQF